MLYSNKMLYSILFILKDYISSSLGQYIVGYNWEFSVNI